MPRYSLDDDAYFSDEDFKTLYRDFSTSVVISGKDLNFETNNEDDYDDISDITDEEKRFQMYIRLFESLKDLVESNYLPIYEGGSSFNLKEFLETH